MAIAAGTGWSELALEALARKGRRAGGARRAVVELLAEQDCCVSAQEAAERLHAYGRPVGVASVYRALDALSTAGLVQRVEVGGATRFEAVVPGGEHHHHLVCDRCGRLTPFADDALERAIQRVAGRVSYRVRGHEVLIRGECPCCAAG